jgi:hypothetical protein
MTLSVLGRGGVPAAGVGAVLLNVTVTNPTAASYVTVWPDGEPRPTASSLNMVAGQTVPNLVAARLGAQGQVDLFNFTGSTDLIADVVGWFPPGTNQLDASTVVVSPTDVSFSNYDPNGENHLIYNGPAQIRAGSYFVTTTAAGPFYGRVTTIDANAITTEPATLDDLYPQLDLSMSADANTGAILAASSIAALPALRVSEIVPNDLSTSSAVSSACQGTVQASVLVDVSVDVGRFEFNYHGNNWIELAYTPTFFASVKASMPSSGSCTVDVHVFSTALPTIEFAIGPVPVWITQHVAADASAKIEVSGSAEVDAGVKAQGRLGALYDHGSFKLEQDFGVEKTLDSVATVNGSADFEVPVTYEADAYGLFGFHSTVGPFARLAFGSNQQPPLTLDAGLAGSVGVQIGVHLGPLSVSASHTFGPYDIYKVRLIPQDPLNVGALRFAGGTVSVIGRTVTVRVRVIAPGGVVDPTTLIWACSGFRLPATNGYVTQRILSADRISGTPVDGVYSIVLPVYYSYGQCVPTAGEVSDSTGRSHIYQGQDLIAAGTYLPFALTPI